MRPDGQVTSIDLDPIDLAEAEMEPRVGGRLIAAAAGAPGHAAAAAGDHGDLGPDGVAVRRRAPRGAATGTGPPLVRL